MGTYADGVRIFLCLLFIKRMYFLIHFGSTCERRERGGVGGGEKVYSKDYRSFMFSDLKIIDIMLMFYNIPQSVLNYGERLDGR